MNFFNMQLSGYFVIVTLGLGIMKELPMTENDVPRLDRRTSDVVRV